MILDHVPVDADPATRQVVTVRHLDGWHARLTLWQQVAGAWIAELEAPGRIGTGGLVAAAERVQDTATTPVGTFPLLEAFGRHDDVETRLDYAAYGPDDYWVQDNESAFYNRRRNAADGGFRLGLPLDEEGSERLADYPVEYEYAVHIGFNVDQVRRRGAGIFLHVDGEGGTGGCVSGPRDFLVALFGMLDPAQRPVIAIGPAHG